ncbi:hypothetical protein [Micromonospora sp. NPDC126480]|uniref:hypothetical protein n=1 Tax=Micromonospora sp. NPDC126480 TaxID=3155312 RepID=UPI00332AF050
MAVGAATLMLAAGCGGESPAEPPAVADAANRLAAYVACLRDQGIDVPDDLASARPGRSGQPNRTARPTARPSGSPGSAGRPGGEDALRPPGVDDATWQQAQQACAGSRPQGGRRGNG